MNKQNEENINKNSFHNGIAYLLIWEMFSKMIRQTLLDYHSIKKYNLNFNWNPL